MIPFASPTIRPYFLQLCLSIYSLTIILPLTISIATIMAHYYLLQILDQVAILIKEGLVNLILVECLFQKFQYY